MDERLQVASWQVAVGDLPSEELVDFACAALERGVDSPSLLQLAGLPHGDVRDAADLFRAALGELGIEPPDEDEALWHLVHWTARQIVAGAVSPIKGARWLWRKAAHQVQEEGDLRVFIGLASAWDDHPEDRTHIEEQIVQEASELLQRPAPRQWLQLRAQHGRTLLTVQRPNGPAPVDPATLPLSESLRHGLARWAAEYDNAADGFHSSSGAIAFVQRGRTLVARCRASEGAL